MPEQSTALWLVLLIHIWEQILEFLTHILFSFKIHTSGFESKFNAFKTLRNSDFRKYSVNSLLWTMLCFLFLYLCSMFGWYNHSKMSKAHDISSHISRLCSLWNGPICHCARLLHHLHQRHTAAWWTASSLSAYAVPWTATASQSLSEPESWTGLPAAAAPLLLVLTNAQN